MGLADRIAGLRQTPQSPTAPVPAPVARQTNAPRPAVVSAPLAVEPGIYHDMPHGDYSRIDAVNWSSLKHMGQSPKHYLHALRHQRPQTDALLLGSVFHTAVLEPDRLRSAYAALPEDAPRRPSLLQRTAANPSPATLDAIEWWDRWQADTAGAEVVEAATLELAMAMAEAVRTDPHAARYLAGARMVETVLVWDCPITGVRCKCRPDLIAARDGGLVLLDLKSTRPADARLFGIWASRQGYHYQLSHYASGCRALGIDILARGLLACESTGPHDVGVFWTDEATDALADEAVELLLRQLAACRADGNWPGRYQDEQTLQMPAWMFAEDDAAGSLGVVFGEAPNG